MFSNEKARDDVIRRMRRVWGEDCSIQIYGSGGRVVGEGEIIRFADLEDLENIMKSRPVPIEDRAC
ncbi:hypothetical protein WK47_25070 [Burkholderia ubonensis]|nr:hypothetical protein WJ74_10760 [Burkholderia ubonensis]KVT01148.1 hypothetical protein WK47_25070 [Burkholderia ubonensis]KVT07419.1 hypothetical protein WK46_10835 [Burkholderia ubonensis]KVT33804.1 hypothetical protein WK50_02450 [Burkholderia ubonensis]